MRHINKYAHIPFLYTKLKEIVDQDPISARIWQQVGRYIGDLFDLSDYEQFNHRYFYPARSLFEWISKDGGLTFEDLADENMDVHDDTGVKIDVSMFISVPAITQMAALGLWFLNVEMNLPGPSTEEDYDENRISPHGWAEASVIAHKAECLLSAYQTLAYVERLQRHIVLTDEEKSRLLAVDFSQLGKKGALKKHAPMRELEAWTIERYREGKWKSANQAAHALMSAVLVHGRTIRAELLPSNAQRTIAGWINDSIKRTPS